MQDNNNNTPSPPPNWYALGFIFPEVPDRGKTITSVYPNGIKISGVPFGMTYTVTKLITATNQIVHKKGWVYPSGVVTVGDGSNVLVFQKDITYFPPSDD